MLLLGIFVVCFFGQAYSSAIANQYFESVLNTALPNQIRSLNLDPAILPNFDTQFEDKVAIIGKVKGRANFTNGHISGLSGTRRLTECQGPYYSFGVKSVNCTIGFHNLHIEYAGKLKYGKMPQVNIKGKANVTDTAIFLEVSNQALKNFLFKQMGNLSMNFTGLGPLNKFTKFLENGFRSHVEAEVFNSMSQRFQYALNNALRVIPMPN